MKLLTHTMLVLMLLLPAICNADQQINNNANSIQQYRCVIMVKYSELGELSREFGDILLSENYENIFQASITLIELLDDIKYEVESIVVPDQMHKAHDVLLKSIDSYIRSANCIRVAIGTYLGEYEQGERGIQELIDQSEQHVVNANKYLSESLMLHEKLFKMYSLVPGECSSQIALITKPDH